MVFSGSILSTWPLFSPAFAGPASGAHSREAGSPILDTLYANFGHLSAYFFMGLMGVLDFSPVRFVRSVRCSPPFWTPVTLPAFAGDTRPAQCVWEYWEAWEYWEVWDGFSGSILFSPAFARPASGAHTRNFGLPAFWTTTLHNAFSHYSHSSHYSQRSPSSGG